jgi:hypothetical protein
LMLDATATGHWIEPGGLLTALPAAGLVASCGMAWPVIRGPGLAHSSDELDRYMYTAMSYDTPCAKCQVPVPGPVPASRFPLPACHKKLESADLLIDSASGQRACYRDIRVAVSLVYVACP